VRSLRIQSRLALLGAALAALAACGDGPEFPTVRDVRPTTLENGDTMVVELDSTVAVAKGAPLRVTLVGDLSRPGEEAVEGSLSLPARWGGPHRVLVDFNDFVQEQVEGHARFSGAVVVELASGGDGPTPVAESGEHLYELDLFPQTARGFGNKLFGHRDADHLLDWLGIEVEHAEDGGGLVVTSVRGGFPGMKFLHDYDCGQWRDGRCKGGPDFKVSLDEAKSRGYTDVDTFDWVDLDGDGFIDRHEIADFLEENGVDPHEEVSLPPSPAAAAGIQNGDVIAAADGHATPTINALYQAWQGKGATATVTVRRGDQQLDLTVARYGREPTVPSGFFMILVLVVTGLLVVLPVPVLGGFIVVWERKISGLMQSRPGPNRVGPRGWLQWLADGVKLIVKEDIIPSEADPLLFRASPLLVFSGVFLTFVVIPFSPVMQVADLNIGILYLLSVTSIVVVGVIMGGWASNSKWSLLGGMRSAAQIVSYELPASVAILAVVITVGSLSTQEMVRSQGGMPWEWNVFANPFGFVCFFIFFISALAEGNRTPFDLPEAESELVSGYNTEYSGFRFSIFALAEWVNLIVIGAFTTTVFLGGWNIPFVGALDAEASLLLKTAAFLIFAFKATAVIFVCIWIRWTLPRFRIDHMMAMCWKYFLPFSLVSLMGAAAWTWMVPGSAQLYLGIVLFVVLGLGILFAFLKRVQHVRKTTSVWDLRGA